MKRIDRVASECEWVLHLAYGPGQVISDLQFAYRVTTQWALSIYPYIQRNTYTVAHQPLGPLSVTQSVGQSVMCEQCQLVTIIYISSQVVLSTWSTSGCRVQSLLTSQLWF